MTAELLAAGLNHTCAPVELREKLAVPDEDRGRVLADLVHRAGLRESMLVSTCNRVEVYGVVDDWARAGERVIAELARMRAVDPEELRGRSFVRGADAAARHIFRVAASLDSMVVGEPQILGQVKDAWQHARDAGLLGPMLDRCLSMAFRGAKRVRNETEIARGAASVPSVASELARSIFGELRGCAVMLVGAGDMAEETGAHLKAAGCSEIVVVNRSEERGRTLAQKIEGRYVEWDRLDSQLTRVDIVVTSTGSQLPIIGRKMLKPLMKTRRHRPVFFVDIAVPRDVASDAADLEHVFLYNIDDLQGIVHDNLRARVAEAERANAVLDEEVETFLRWQRTRAVGPVIGQLQRHGREIVQAEIERLLRRLPADLDPEHRSAVEQMGHAIMKKLLHSPTSALREAAAHDTGGSPELVDALSTLFRLQEQHVESSTASSDESVADPETVSVEPSS